MKNRKILLAILFASMLGVSACNNPNNFSNTTSSNPQTSDVSSISSDVSSSQSSSEASSESSSERQPIHVSSVSLDKASLSIQEGSTAQLTHTVLPEDADNKNVTWSSSNESVATVNNGVVTALIPGKATITVTTEDGSKTASCEVTVEKLPVHVSSVSLDKSALTLEVGSSETLTHTVLPEDADNKDVTWSSSNESVATINNGVVTAVSRGSATITVTTADGEKSATCSVTVEQHHNITTSSNDDVSINVASTAQEGDVVTISLTYDASSVEVKKVLANTIECGTSLDGSYYFVMPNEDVVISVETSPIVVNTYKKIKNYNSSAVTLHGISEQAVVGETVSFTFSITPGYSFNGSVSVRTDTFNPENSTEIALTYENGSYSFTMPNEAVIIDVGTSKGVYTVTFDKDYSTTLISSVYADGTSIWSTGYASFNSLIEVKMKTNDKYRKPTGIHVVETNKDYMLPENGNEIEFYMPYYGITLEALSTPYYRNFNLNNSEHITLSAYTKNDAGEYVLMDENKAVLDDMIYLKAESQDANTYQVKGVNAKYKGQYGDVNVSSTLNTDGYYEIKMPEVGDTDSLSISVLEKNITLFANYPFVGSYRGFEMWTTGSYTESKFSSSYSLNIDSSGSVVKGTNYYYQIANATSSDGEGVITMTNDSGGDCGEYAYNDKIFIGRYNFSKNSIVTNDMIIAVKKQDPNDDDSLYTVKGEYILNRKYGIFAFYRDNQFYAGVYIDVSAGKYYISDVTFEMTSGTYINDTDAAYVIKQNGTPIASIGYNGSGGYSNRVVYDAVKGEYHTSGSEEATLVLDGVGGATYNGANYAYTYSGNTITLTQGLTTVVIEIDPSTGEYSVTSEDVYVAQDALDLRTFTGTMTMNNDPSDTYFVSVEFVGRGLVKVYVAYYSGGFAYVGGTSDATRLANQTYIITDNKVQVNFYEYSSYDDMASLVFEISEDNNTLTIIEAETNIPHSSQYDWETLVLTAKN